MNPAMIQAIIGLLGGGGGASGAAMSSGEAASLFQTAMAASGQMKGMEDRFRQIAHQATYGADQSVVGYGGPGGKALYRMKEKGEEIGEAGKTAMNPLADPMSRAQAYLKIGGEIATFPATVRDWGEELKKSSEHLKIFNGAIATTYAQSEFRDITRSRASAERTADSNRYMVESLDDLQDALQPIADDITNIANVVMGTLADSATVGVAALSGASRVFLPNIMGAVEAISKYFVTKRVGGGSDGPGVDFINYIREGGLRDRKPLMMDGAEADDEDPDRGDAVKEPAKPGLLDPVKGAIGRSSKTSDSSGGFMSVGPDPLSVALRAIEVYSKGDSTGVTDVAKSLAGEKSFGEKVRDARGGKPKRPWWEIPSKFRTIEHDAKWDRRSKEIDYYDILEEYRGVDEHGRTPVERKAARRAAERRARLGKAPAVYGSVEGRAAWEAAERKARLDARRGRTGRIEMDVMTGLPVYRSDADDLLKVRIAAIKERELIAKLPRPPRDSHGRPVTTTVPEAKRP